MPIRNRGAGVREGSKQEDIVKYTNWINARRNKGNRSKNLLQTSENKQTPIAPALSGMGESIGPNWPFKSQGICVTNEAGGKAW